MRVAISPILVGGAPGVFGRAGGGPAVVALGPRRGRAPVLHPPKEDHDEVIGTLGEAPDRNFVIASAEGAEKLEVPDPNKIAYLTQTTLSVDDTRDVIDALRLKFPKIHGPSRDDICYATQNRQAAVKRLASDVDVLLVIGAANSSNANRLVEVAQTAGTRAYLINDVGDIRPEWLEGGRRGGGTAGAPAPAGLVAGTVEGLRRPDLARRGGPVGAEDGRVAPAPQLDKIARERGTPLPTRPAARQSL